ncbi:hypothetical protein PAHAL_9G016600 [Panicum hallii]|uniref:Uncharacterized protein n=1 Tax=Panicum hallii TaxID=206008 RepID=A0A2T8HZS3_9POAL|nr:hypothetical protein PAHAL_9G016600 [Panicum hallii]
MAAAPLVQLSYHLPAANPSTFLSPFQSKGDSPSVLGRSYVDADGCCAESEAAADQPGSQQRLRTPIDRDERRQRPVEWAGACAACHFIAKHVCRILGKMVVSTGFLRPKQGANSSDNFQVEQLFKIFRGNSNGGLAEGRATAAAAGGTGELRGCSSSNWCSREQQRRTDLAWQPAAGSGAARAGVAWRPRSSWLLSPAAPWRFSFLVAGRSSCWIPKCDTHLISDFRIRYYLSRPNRIERNNHGRLAVSIHFSFWSSLKETKIQTFQSSLSVTECRTAAAELVQPRASSKGGRIRPLPLGKPLGWCWWTCNANEAAPFAMCLRSGSEFA